jgi:hypothetical protein
MAAAKEEEDPRSEDQDRRKRIVAVAAHLEENIK